MKKTFKLLALIIIVAVLSTLLIGCNSDEMALFNSLAKQNQITSMESKTELTMSFSASGFSATEQPMIDQFSPMLNGSKILITQKTKSNKELTSTLGQVDLSVNLGGMAVDTSVWVDAEVTGAKPKMMEIIKIPAMLSPYLPASAKGKQYILFDLGKSMASVPAASFDINKIMSISKNLTPKLLEFLKDYFTQFDPGFTSVTKVADKPVNGETLSVYELKLDDKSFKQLIQYGVKNFMENEKALSFVKDFVTEILNASGLSSAELKKSTDEMNKAFNDLKAGSPKFIDSFNKVMAVLENVKMLGDKGIVIDFGINSDGFIVSETGTVDLSLDLKALADAGENINLLNDSSYKKNISTQTGIINLGIDFTNSITNINKDISVTMPAVNAQNSVSMEELMGTVIAATPYSKTTPVPAPAKKDITPPVKPVVNSLLHTAKVITGKAEAGSTIVVKKGTTVIGTGVTNAKGVFSIAIKAQKAKTILLVTAMDKSKNLSKAASVIVK